MTTATGILFEDPCVKPFSTAGLQQAGCYALFFLTGGTTPANVYADGFLTTPLTQVPGSSQPSCTADGSGLFNPIYLDPSVVYHVQMFTSTGVKFRDVDPYVPLPIPAEIASLITAISSVGGSIAAINAAIAALQASYPWINITGVPAPLVALGASSPPGSGLTFWCDNGTWKNPSAAGALIAKAISIDVGGIGSSYTPVISGVPVTPGATYSAHFEDTLVAAGQSGTWQFGTQVTSDQAGVITAEGGGVMDTTQTDFALIGSYGNLASNSAAANLFGTATQYLTADSVFSVDATTSSVTLALKVTSGTLTAKAGGFLRLIQIA